MTISMKVYLLDEGSDCLSIVGRWCQIALKKPCQIPSNLTDFLPSFLGFLF